jgi:multidrug transporter EmrE-like cation transporter
MKWFILLLGIASNASASVLIKVGMLPPRQFPTPANPWVVFENIPLLLGMLLYVVAFGLYAIALKYFPLNIAHPMLTSGAIATVTFLSVAVLGESLRPTMFLGLGFMILGAILLTSGR